MGGSGAVGAPLKPNALAMREVLKLPCLGEDVLAQTVWPYIWRHARTSTLTRQTRPANPARRYLNGGSRESADPVVPPNWHPSAECFLFRAVVCSIPCQNKRAVRLCQRGVL